MKKNKGFTLLEMLVIVGCIAALVAIGYPQFTGMMENNREKTDIMAMKSAYTLLETAYNTGLLFDGQPVTAYDASHPLYYDGNGKLTAVKPAAPYGEGRARSGSGTASYCDDYRYDSSRDYTADVIVCFYDADTKTLHVHWEPLATAGGGSTGGNPGSGSTGGNTGGGTTGGGTTGGSTGGGTGNPDPGETPVEDNRPDNIKDTAKEIPWDEVNVILRTGHPYPKSTQINGWTYTTNDFPVVYGHRYIFNNKVYAAVLTKSQSEKYTDDTSGFNPTTAAYAFVEIKGPVFTSRDNIAMEQNGALVVNNQQKGIDGRCELLYIPEGSIFLQFNEDGTIDYYVRRVEGNGITPLKESEGKQEDNYAGHWVKLIIPGCDDCSQMELPDGSKPPLLTEKDYGKLS